MAASLLCACITAAVLASRSRSAGSHEQTLAATETGDALVQKFFPDYSKLQSLAKDLSDDHLRNKAFTLLEEVRSKVHAYSRLQIEAKSAVQDHLHYEMDLAKRMQREKQTHDAIPAIQHALSKSRFELTTAQTKLRHEQMAVGDLIAPRQLDAPIQNKHRAVTMSLSQAQSSGSQSNLPPAVRKAVAFARQAESERYEPELNAEHKRRRTYDELHAKLVTTKSNMNHAARLKKRDGQLLASVTKRINYLKTASHNSLKSAKLAFEDADRMVRKGQNEQAFKQGAKLLQSANKVPTTKDIEHDLLS